jgi:hypothetical protein
MEYGTILIATAAPGEHLMVLFREERPANLPDWMCYMLLSDDAGQAGRVVWVPEEVLRGDDPAYVEAPQ